MCMLFYYKYLQFINYEEKVAPVGSILKSRTMNSAVRVGCI